MAAKERSSSAGSYIDTIPPIYDDSAWISMGSKLVNGHIGRGILLGTVAEVYGPSQSRKTTLCLSTASHAQRAALFKHKGQTVDLQLCEDAIFKGSAIAFQKLTQRPLGARNVYGLWTDRHDDVDLDGETKQELIEQMESASDIWTLRYEWLQARMPNAVLPIFRPPLKVIYLGSEVGGFLEEVAINLGVDLPALRVLYVDMVEEAFRELSDFSQECERDGCKGLAILDSLANLSTKTEKYRPDSVGMYGDQGKVIREEWRRNHKDIAERGVTVLAVSHMTGTGGKTGGTGTSFIASQIIQQTVEMADSNHPADDAWFLGEDGVSRVGIRVKIHCDKRRFSGLDGDAEVTVRYDIPGRLVDPVYDTFDFLRATGIIQQAGAYWKVMDPITGEQIDALRGATGTGSFMSNAWEKVHDQNAALWPLLETQFYEKRYEEMRQARSFSPSKPWIKRPTYDVLENLNIRPKI